VMDCQLLWRDAVPSKEKTTNAANDVCISPDGSKAIVAVGNKVPYINYFNYCLN
jgi:hypothetical protein